MLESYRRLNETSIIVTKCLTRLVYYVDSHDLGGGFGQWLLISMNTCKKQMDF